MAENSRDNNAEAKTLYSLKKNTLDVLEYVARRDDEIPYANGPIQKSLTYAPATVKRAKQEILELVDSVQVHLKQEHRQCIRMRLFHVTMKSNAKEHLESFESFLRTIPNISDIYRVTGIEADYVIKVNCRHFDDHTKIRDLLSDHLSVSCVRSMQIEKAVNTPNTELSFLFSSFDW